MILVLGTGVNTISFSVLHAALFRPLPFPGADRLVTLFETHPERGQMALSTGNFLDLTGEKTVFRHVTGGMAIPLELTGAGQPQIVTAHVVLPDFFSVRTGKLRNRRVE